MWPATTRRNDSGELEIGGVSVTAIAARFGTPVYLYDEATLRDTARRFRAAFAAEYPESRVVYAAKAFLTRALVRILDEEGLGLDVVSGGELAVGLRAGMPANRMTLHGSNKDAGEIREALNAGVGTIVIDNLHDIDLLAPMVSRRATPIQVLLRVNPSVDVHTHRKISTGLADSKFGLPVASGLAEAAVIKIRATPGLDLAGYHAHVGSQLFDTAATIAAIDELLAFAAAMRARHGVALCHLSPGGGFGIGYVEGDTPPEPEAWAATIAGAVRAGCDRHGLPLPTLTVEPGRAIAGPAGVALYTVGAIKRLSGVRTYVSVDGGMADNIRPSLYGAEYTATIANRLADGEREPVTIAGRYCESGDVLIERLLVASPRTGDLLAIPAAGAYTLSMASNYNMALRPTVVLVRDGSARLIRRRETYDDLLRCDVTEGDGHSSSG